MSDCLCKYGMGMFYGDRCMKCGNFFVWDDAVPPIATRHVGTIAFQGTDAQINEAMQRYFGGAK